jgi:tetratricopeptide (TPR) repeat protein
MKNTFRWNYILAGVLLVTSGGAQEIKTGKDQNTTAPSRIPGATNLLDAVGQMVRSESKTTETFNSIPADYDKNAKELYEAGEELFFKKNRADEGIEKMRAALKIDPRCPNAYVNLGNWYALGKRDNQTALELLQQGLEHCPKSSSVRFEMGNTYARLNQHKTAIQHFNTALELGIESKASVYYNIGNSYVALRDVGEAKNFFRKAVVEDEKHLNARRNLVIAYVQTGDSRTARQEAERLLELDPNGEKGAWAKEALQQIRP